MALYKYTTKIDADKTAGEISKMLTKAGAKRIMTEYDEKDSYVTSLSFSLNIEGREVGFRLPSDWKPVLTILENDRKVPRNLVTRDQAVRVAWRIVMAWVEAQLALIETRMVTTQQVFLPYAVAADGRTLYEHMESNPAFLLGSGE